MIVKSRHIETMAGELHEMTREERDAMKQREEKKKRDARMEVGMCKTFADLQRIAKERGYARGWVFQQAKIKGIRS
jgi:hypothetical protein